MTYRWLVCRKDAIKNGGTSTIQSSCFPILVETNPNFDGITECSYPEYIVRKAMNQISDGYVGKYTYVVIPMIDAKVVAFRKPQPEYEVHITNF